MKKKVIGMFLGVLVTGMLFCGCGKNEAAEAASESARTEQEGVGEETVEEVTTEEQDSESKDTESNSSETEESDAEASKILSFETEEEIEEEVDREKIAICLPNDEEWIRDADEFQIVFEEDGYEPIILYAENNAEMQIEQIRQMAESEVSALVIAPVDAYGLSEVLEEVSEASIPVFSYDDLIMDTNVIKYYVTFGGRQMGQMIAQAIVEREELAKVQEAGETRTIEFLMGSLDDTQALFLYNGIMEILQPYLDDGTLVCRSEKISFEDTGILRWSGSLAKTRMAEILDTSYEDGEAPDIICTGFDDAALGAQEALKEAEIYPGSEQWPLISGVGCTSEGVRKIGEDAIEFSIFIDRRTLADKCEEMVHIYLHGEDDPEVNDYEQYDNGVKIIGTFLCEAKLIDCDNYELLIDNGYYGEAEVTPMETPIPTPTERIILKRAE